MLETAKVKKGHQAPKNLRWKLFNSIEIDGDFHYCKSHNFVYNEEIEEQKLYNAIPCYYTDSRFIDGRHNFYKNCYIKWQRSTPFTLKSAIRTIMNVKNIPKGTIVKIKKSWHFKKKIKNHFNFKIQNENVLDVNYEINIKEYFNNFTSDEKAQQLVDRLRNEGFIVKVYKNENFLTNMLNSAIALTGSGDLQDNEIEGEIAIAYGYNKKIGFSSENHDLYGYSNGCDNILYDFYGSFDKWSRCEEIPKTTNIEEIINILKSEEIEN